jgi:class 3 adenylate cyclase
MPDSPGVAPEASRSFGATVTILFSDIRGFTEYTNHFGDEAAFDILRQHNTIVRKQIELFGGQVVKTQGDSFMVSFTTARGAILCAVAVQRAIAETNRDHTDTRIAVGIGINTGEPIQEGGDFFGSTVNLAARVCAAAGPAQILISETTRHVAGRIDTVEYVDRGLHELKGFPEAQRLYEVGWLPRDLRPRPAGEARPDPVDLAALEPAVQRAIGVLNRVLAVAHLDDATFRPLLECQAKASELRLALSRAVSEQRGFDVKRVEETMLPFADFLSLVLGREHLDDLRWAQLEASVTRAFGRPLAVAATRGRLAVEGGDRDGRRGPVAAPAGGNDGRVGRSEPPRDVPPPPPADPRAEAVPWWARAHEAWREWKLSGMAHAHALRAALMRCPHFLAVPVRAAAGGAGAPLAAQYFLLLEHAEAQAPGFLRTAIDEAIAAAGGAAEPAALDAALYELLVGRGRLRDTYAEFVREVMNAAIPNPGVWADGGVSETDDATVITFGPPGSPGEPAEETQRLTDPQERGLERRFPVTLAPLTSRFFYARAGELKTARDLRIALLSDGAPSADAWYLTLRTGHVVHSQPRRLDDGAVALPGLGREHGGVWIAVFNPDPEASRSCELTLRIAAPTAAAGRHSPFSRRGRGPA